MTAEDGFPEWVRNALYRHRRGFERLLSATERMAGHDPLSAAVYAQATAEYAWRNHPGRHRSEQLEAILTRLAEARPGLTEQGSRPQRRTGQPHVLHVLTQAYSAFGHTRLCWRWMQADAHRRHSVALTNQSPFPIPDEIAGAVQRRGGSVVDLSEGKLPLLRRAEELRRIAAGFDHVVLHIHPYDVVAALAFRHTTDPVPVLLVNHADHVFWLGADSCDAVAFLRWSSERICRERRGIQPGRLVLLPLPLETLDEAARDAARDHLGFAPAETVLISIGSAYKYEDEHGIPAVEAIEPVVRQRCDARAIFVGPLSEGLWREAERRTGGRVAALGPRSSVGLYYQAGDIYVDSFPMSSMTALLEAAQHGLPVLRMAPRAPWERKLVQVDDPAVGNTGYCEDPRAMREALLRLIDNPEERLAAGESLRRRVEGYHCQPGWQEHVDRAYGVAREKCGLPRERKPTPAEIDEIDLGLTLVHLRGDVEAAYLRLLWAHIRLLRGRRARLVMAARFTWALRDDVAMIRPSRLRRAARRALGRRRARHAAAVRRSAST